MHEDTRTHTQVVTTCVEGEGERERGERGECRSATRRLINQVSTKELAAPKIECISI